MIGIKIEDLKISKRIACHSAGYPAHEALYLSVKEYEDFTGNKLVHNFCDNCGYANGVCPGCYAEGRDK